MGKDNVGAVGSDAFCRINYLLQAAYSVLKETPQNVELARHYIHTLRSVAKRQVLRIHPDIKRVLCKKCSMLLIPGATAKIRKKGKKQKHVVVTCLDCGTIKRFPTKANYQLWMDRAEAWVTDQSQQKKQQPVIKKPQRKDSSHAVQVIDKKTSKD